MKFTIDQFEYLDDLKFSGAVNMMGTRQYLKQHFLMDDETALLVVSAWMSTYEVGLSTVKRVNIANSKLSKIEDIIND